MKRIFTFIFALALVATSLASLSLQAQNEKVDNTLSLFEDTEFMKKFTEMKEKAQTAVQQFKSTEQNYTPDQVAKVKAAYDKTQSEFNKVLETVKTDMTDKNKRKYIEKYPEDYSKSMELDLYRLKDFYSENFEQVLLDVTAGNIDGGGFLLILTQLIGITDQFVNMIIRFKAQKKHLSEEYVQENFIEPNQFPEWENVESGNNGGYDNPGYETPNDGYDDGGYDNSGNGGYDDGGYDNSGNGGYDDGGYDNSGNGGYDDGGYDNSGNGGYDDGGYDNSGNGGYDDGGYDNSGNSPNTDTSTKPPCKDVDGSSKNTQTQTNTTTQAPMATKPKVKEKINELKNAKKEAPKKKAWDSDDW